MSRGGAIDVADGFYATPDPDQPDVMTLWIARAGSLRDWPAGERWRPLKPSYPDHLATREERQEWAANWYEQVYFPWRQAVREAIEANPQGAVEAFRALHPDAVMPPKPTRRVPDSWPVPRRRKPVTAEEKRLAEERTIATALHMAGLSYAEIAETLNVPKTTAFRRVQLGMEAIGDGDPVSRVILSLSVEKVCERLRESALAAGLADDGEQVRQHLDRLRRLREALVSGRQVVRG